MRRIAFELLVLMTTCLVGCLPNGMAQESDSSSAPTATVTLGEIEFEDPDLPKGCVASVTELPASHLVQADDPRLQSDRLIVVIKSSRRVMLFSDGDLRHDRPGNQPDCWWTGLGWNPTFDKKAEGDGRTPEGWFRTSDKPWSSFYGAIHVSYPSERHAKQALTQGRISQSTYKKIAQAQKAGAIPPQKTPLGGDILLHGGGSTSDWTAGCMALTNHDIDELRELLPTGMKTRILILP